MSTEQHLHGIVRGRTVELSDDPGIQSGVEVEVILRPTAVGSSQPGLERCAGALAELWTDEDDRILAEIQAARSVTGNRKLPE